MSNTTMSRILFTITYVIFFAAGTITLIATDRSWFLGFFILSLAFFIISLSIKTRLPKQ